MTTRKTLKDFLRNHTESTQDRLTFNVASEDGMANQYTGKDLGKDTGTDQELLDLQNEQIGLLGDYLNYIVKESTNIFKIAPGNEEAAPSNRGESLVLAEEQGAENVFVNQGTEQAANLNQYSNSNKMDADDLKVSDVIDKTGKESNSHKLLNSVAGNDLSSVNKVRVNQQGVDHEAVKLSNNLIINHNRFANLNNKPVFKDDNLNARDFESGESESGTVSVQDNMGDFDKNLQKISLDELKKLGTSLLLKSSGFDISLTPDDSKTDGELKNDILKSKITSKHVSNTGYVKSNVELLRTRNAAGFPTDAGGSSVRAGDGEFFGLDPEASNASSFGSTYNNVLRHGFSNSEAIKFQTAAAVVAMIKASSDLFNVIASISNTKKANQLKPKRDEVVQKEPKYNGPGPHNYGNYKPSFSDKLDFLKKQLLTETQYPYITAAEMGIKIFFGAKKPKIDDAKKYDHISQAPAFWLAVANSVLKSTNEINQSLQLLNDGGSFKPKNLAGVVRELQRTKIIGFMNVAATVGDIFLQSTGGRTSFNALKNLKRIRDVDALPDGPGTRISKIRAANDLSSLNLSYKQSSVPSLYMLPRNIVRAVTSLGNLSVGTNPAKGMLGSDLIKETYLDQNMDGSYNRIPEDVVRRLEDRLDAEYVPFYIQDLRTNEIISFHAFLDQLQDSISPNFSAQGGYGRLDDVQIYQGTKRTIQVGFTLFATSKEDFNNMWFKINKLTTLLYPQWTPGMQIKDDRERVFRQPFSQVIGASPIVRLRVGDVIKSNYSKFNLQRIFGAGESDSQFIDAGNDEDNVLERFSKRFNKKIGGINKTLDELGLILFYGIYGTPLQSPLLKNEIIRNLASNFLINGTVNPLGAGVILNQLQSPDQNFIDPVKSFTIGSLGESRLTPGNGTKSGYAPLSVHFLKPTMNRKYLCVRDGKEYVLDRPVRILIKGLRGNRDTVDIKTNDPTVSSENFKSFRNDFKSERVVYKVNVIDLTAPFELLFADFYVYHEDILPNPNALFNTFVMPTFLNLRAIGDALLTPIIQEASLAAGLGSEFSDFARNKIFKSLLLENEFFKPEENSLVRAFDTTKGRGLAGTLGAVSFNWLEFPWEVDWNSRAPKGVKISFSLNVIHDLPPGLDSAGFNRAPLYNVGDVMRHVAGDPHNDNGAASEFNYKNEGRKTFRSDKGE